MTATTGATATPVPTTMIPAAVLADGWPPGGDLVTPTMKVRRRPVLRTYACRVDALHAEH